MGIIEIHLKDDKLYKVSGHDAIVYVHDHNKNEVTTMRFKKQEKSYENWKNTEPSRFSFVEENIDPRQRKDNL